MVDPSVHWDPTARGGAGGWVRDEYADDPQPGALPPTPSADTTPTAPRRPWEPEPTTQGAAGAPAAPYATGSSPPPPTPPRRPWEAEAGPGPIAAPETLATSSHAWDAVSPWQRLRSHPAAMGGIAVAVLAALGLIFVLGTQLGEDPAADQTQTLQEDLLDGDAPEPPVDPAPEGGRWFGPDSTQPTQSSEPSGSLDSFVTPPPAGSVEVPTTTLPPAVPVEPTLPSPDASDSKPAVGSTPFWTVIVASWTTAENGEPRVQQLSADLSLQGYDALAFFSSDYGSLNAGYWVATTGQFPTKEQASDLAQRLAADGYADTYPRCVGTKAQCA